jgi:choline-sulfatase
MEGGISSLNANRRDVLKSLGVAAALSQLNGARTFSAGPAAARNPSSGGRPNILVFLTDDHGQWLQQAYGNTEVRTPNLNRIASRGIRMANAYTPCPVCSPARASFFTGRTPSQHGIHDWIEEKTQAYAVPWLKGQTLLSEHLHNAGYHTGLVGKWHCGEERYPHPGFDYWFSYWVSQYPHRGKQNFSENGQHVEADGFQSPLLTERAINFLRGHYRHQETAQRPFFLYVGYTDTHTPHIDMPEDLVALYKQAKFRDVPNEALARCHGKALSPVSDDPAVELANRQQYYAAASSVDREVGKILDELENTGQLANTLVVYTGDHGLNAGQHGIWEKGNATLPQNFLEESIRIPCLLSWPGGEIVENLHSDLWVNHCDLHATLLEAAGVVPEATLAKEINSPGQSYLSFLRGNSGSKWRDYAICEYGNARMYRTDGYKLILRYPYKGTEFANEFYDLAADPRETANLYAQAGGENSQVIKEMGNQLREFFMHFTAAEHDGLDLEHQPQETPASPWLMAQTT